MKIISSFNFTILISRELLLSKTVLDEEIAEVENHESLNKFKQMIIHTIYKINIFIRIAY